MALAIVSSRDGMSPAYRNGAVLQRALVDCRIHLKHDAFMQTILRLLGSTLLGISFAVIGFALSISFQALGTPSLTVTLASDEDPPKVRLFWPNPSTGFVLQSTTNLANPASWQAANLPVWIVNGKNFANEETVLSGVFYRLVQPGSLKFTSLVFDQTNVIQQCEYLFLTASAFTPTNDTLTYQWQVLSNPPAANFSFVPVTNSATFSAHTLGDYTFQVGVNGNAGATDSLFFTVTVEAVHSAICNPEQIHCRL
jgi:hypothetical protein